jgi:hypothetical protein
MFEILRSAYKEEYLSGRSMFEWHKMFKEGQKSLQEDEQKGRPSSSRTEVFAQRSNLSVWMLEVLTGTNRDTVHKISVGDLKRKEHVLILFLIC